MGYIQNNLIPGEKILHSAKLHWIVFLRPALLIILLLGVFSSESFAYSSQMFLSRNIIGFVKNVLLVITLYSSIVSIVDYVTSEFGVTNKRVIAKIGFIQRNSVEILLKKVEGIQVKQSILARMLGYGTIIITGTGGLHDPFHKISNPLLFRRKVQEQIP